MVRNDADLKPDAGHKLNKNNLYISLSDLAMCVFYFCIFFLLFNNF